MRHHRSQTPSRFRLFWKRWTEAYCSHTYTHVHTHTHIFSASKYSLSILWHTYLSIFLKNLQLPSFSRKRFHLFPRYFPLTNILPFFLFSLLINYRDIRSLHAKASRISRLERICCPSTTTSSILLHLPAFSSPFLALAKYFEIFRDQWLYLPRILFWEAGG